MSCEIRAMLDRYLGGCPGWHVLSCTGICFPNSTVEYSFRLFTEGNTGKVLGSVERGHLHTRRGAQRCNGRGEAQLIPCQAAPRSIAEAIRPSKTHLHKPREQPKSRTPKQQPTCLGLFQHGLSSSVWAWSPSPPITASSSPQHLSDQ